MTAYSALREAALACHRAGVAAVEPGRIVARRLVVSDDRIALRDDAGRAVHRHAGDVVLVAVGKASVGMATAAAGVLGARCRVGVVIAPHGACPPLAPPLEAWPGGHPIPDAASLAATARALEVAGGARRDTLVLVLLSGGASALLEAPADAITLADVQALTSDLLASGAGIHAVNVVRRHCSRVKGGGLARAAAGSRAIWTLVLSDVIGDDVAAIGSGPTVPDPTSYADALSVLARWRVVAPEAVRRHLEQGAAGEVAGVTPTAGDVFLRSHPIFVGRNADAVAAAVAEAARRGFVVHRLADPIVGDAADAGRRLAATIRGAAPDVPTAWVGGGETTVRVRPGGRGGRSQHLALAAAIGIADLPAVVLAAGTDGIDGPTVAAGGLVDGDTLARARALGLDPSAALDATDSGPVLDATGDLVVTGPTGTNVADLVVALRVPA